MTIGMELFPLFGFMELKTLLVIAHLFGVALGAGVAVFSAIMFMKVMWDGEISKKEFEFIQLGSLVVACGLGLLILSGIGLFFLNPEQYLASSKFLAKMTIIGILAANGFLIHLLHVPALRENLGRFLPEVPGFAMRSMAMYAGGAVSMTSWASALILGAFRSIPYSYGAIMLCYAGILALAIVLALALRAVTFGKIRRSS